MRFRLLLVFVLGTLPGFSQAPAPCNKILQFRKLLDEHHIQPQVWDTAFTNRVINRLFSLVDPDAIYLTEEEKASFLCETKAYNASLTEGSCLIIQNFGITYRQGLTRAEGFVKEIQGTPINPTERDTLQLNFITMPFLPEAQLKSRWKRLIKWGMLLDAANQGGSPDLSTSLDKNCKKYSSIIKHARKTQESSDYLVGKLLNAIASSYDPYTAFLSKNDKQAFLDALSTSQFSYGVILQDDALGNVTIGRIVPGSSAWDAGKLHENDIVISIKTSITETIDASLYSARELDAILSSLRGPVDLFLKKANGERITVTLVKQKIRDDENKVKSLVLSNPENRFGYVNLPVFFNGEKPNTGCASALAKEIVQLKKSKIQGLILDLRDNGGGDLEEAILLTGIFIDHGAVAIIKYNNGNMTTLKDVNPGVAYDGPLVIMVNGGTASASELFAAAMRAHHRAIIVGSPTFGKGTGQTGLPFGNAEMVKITNFRFYDPNGKSHQGKGLQPDILLPDIQSLYDPNESHYPYALRADSVLKKTYYTSLTPLPLHVLRDSAQHRIARNPFFEQLASERANDPRVNRELITIPLTLSDLERFQKKRKIAARTSIRYPFVTVSN